MIGVLLAAIPLAAQIDPVTVDQNVSRVRPFVGERLELTVEIEVDAVFADASMVALFRRPLDLPVQLELPWLRVDALRAMSVPSLGDAATGRTVRIAVDGVVMMATERRSEPGAESRRVLSLRWWIVPPTDGELRLAPPTLRYAWATGFDVDLFGKRRPLDRQDAVARGPESVLDVRALPRRGRPSAFTGAVGNFTVHSSIDRDRVPAGESAFLTLRILGDGDLHGFPAPRLDAIAGFDLLGQLEPDDGEARVVVYELAPNARSTREIPALEFAFFDPAEDGTYRVARTAPIPLQVVPGAVLLPPTPLRAVETAEAPTLLAWDAASRGGGASVRLGLVWAAIILPWSIALAAWVAGRVRRHRATPAVRVRRAAGRLAARITGRGGDAFVRDSLIFFAAEVLDAPSASVVGPGLAGRLAARGVRPSDAGACEDLIHQTLGTAYGGPRVADAAARARALATSVRARGRSVEAQR